MNHHRSHYKSFSEDCSLWQELQPARSSRTVVIKTVLRLLNHTLPILNDQAELTWQYCQRTGRSVRRRKTRRQPGFSWEDLLAVYPPKGRKKFVLFDKSCTPDLVVKIGMVSPAARLPISDLNSIDVATCFSVTSMRSAIPSWIRTTLTIN